MKLGEESGCSTNTINPIDGDALEEPNNKSGEATDAVVQKVDEVNTASGHHGKAKQEVKADDGRPEDVTMAGRP